MEQEITKPLDQLMKELTPRELRKGLKAGYRQTAKKARKVALRYLHASSLQVKGNKGDLDKGLRAYIYSKGGGFLLTVNARRATKSGKGEKGMHENRYGKKKPVLMWAEDGTQKRQRGGRTFTVRGNLIYGSQRSERLRYYKIRKRVDGVNTGAMPAYSFLDKATPEVTKVVEAELSTQIKESVEKVARKSGLL
jgi:hypothetical protein